MQDIIEINGIEYVRKESMPHYPITGNLVIVRTYSAGVHIGNFNPEDWKDPAKPIKLKNARRLWRWRGAMTLNEVALRGVNREQHTRISKPVEAIYIVPIEIIPVASGLDFSEVWND